MASDGGLRPLFRKMLARDAHWQSVETGMVTAGVPDANVCFAGGVEAWIEMKATNAWSPVIRPEQVGWHMVRARVGGRSFFAVRRSHDGGPRKGDPVDELWICRGVWARELREGGIRHPDLPWEGMWAGGPMVWNWKEIREVLMS